MKLPFETATYRRAYFVFSFSIEFIIRQSNLTPLYSNNEISQVNLFANTDTCIHVSCRTVCKSHWNVHEMNGTQKRKKENNNNNNSAKEKSDYNDFSYA